MSDVGWEGGPGAFRADVLSMAALGCGRASTGLPLAAGPMSKNSGAGKCATSSGGAPAESHALSAMRITMIGSVISDRLIKGSALVLGQSSWQCISGDQLHRCCVLPVPTPVPNAEPVSTLYFSVQSHPHAENTLHSDGHHHLSQSSTCLVTQP